MLKDFTIVSITLFFILFQSVFAASGLFFNVSATGIGTPNDVNITLCLDGKGPISCQSYDVSALTLSILTTISSHVYPLAGIKINTPGYTLANSGVNCAPFDNGYCLFSVNNKTPKIISINSDNGISYCQNGTNYLPAVITLPLNGTPVTLPLNYFFNTTNGLPAINYPTSVTLNYNASDPSITIQFINYDDIYVTDNQYTTNNSAMWNQEVFEMFISAGPTTPTNYVEIEVNPNNALFSAYIYNPNGLGTENTVTFFDGTSEGVTLSTHKETSSWNGTLTFPLEILGDLNSTYRINFFRVVANQAPDMSTTWACTNTSCTYLAWNPTCSGTNPAFHIPAYFGSLNLVISN